MSFVSLYVVSHKTDGVVNNCMEVNTKHSVEKVANAFCDAEFYNGRGGRLAGDLLIVWVSATVAAEISAAVKAKHYQKAASLVRNFAHSIQKVGDIT